MADSSDWDLKEYIRDIPNFPQPGILFRDITPLLAEPRAFQETDPAIRRSLPRFEDRCDRGRRSSWVHLCRAAGYRIRRRLCADSKTGENCLSTPIRFTTNSNTAKTRSRCTSTGSAKGAACSCSTTCWPPAARWTPCCQLLEKCGAEVFECAFLINLKGARRREAGRPVSHLQPDRIRVDRASGTHEQYARTEPSTNRCDGLLRFNLVTESDRVGLGVLADFDGDLHEHFAGLCRGPFHQLGNSSRERILATRPSHLC